MKKILFALPFIFMISGLCQATPFLDKYNASPISRIAVRAFSNTYTAWTPITVDATVAHMEICVAPIGTSYSAQTNDVLLSWSANPTSNYITVIPGQPRDIWCFNQTYGSAGRTLYAASADPLSNTTNSVAVVEIIRHIYAK